MEIWNPVVGYEELFEVSDLGNFRNKVTGRNLKPVTHKSGYKLVSTRPEGRGGVCKTFKVHREVAKAFIENPLEKPQVNHIDGNKGNNNLTNLEWVTGSENMQHAVLLGLVKIPDNSPYKKLSEDQIREFLTDYCPYSRDFGMRAFARKFGIDKTALSKILVNKGYKT